MKDSAAATFSGLIDLAAAALGGYALGTNDDFFAGMQNLLHPGRGTFITDKYTDRGKWMDGWESRRKRRPGHDHCIVELGRRGTVLAVDEQAANGRQMFVALGEVIGHERREERVVRPVSVRHRSILPAPSSDRSALAPGTR